VHPGEALGGDAEVALGVLEDGGLLGGGTGVGLRLGVLESLELVLVEDEEEAEPGGDAEDGHPCGGGGEGIASEDAVGQEGESEDDLGAEPEEADAGGAGVG